MRTLIYSRMNGLQDLLIQEVVEQILSGKKVVLAAPKRALPTLRQMVLDQAIARGADPMEADALIEDLPPAQKLRGPPVHWTTFCDV